MRWLLLMGMVAACSYEHGAIDHPMPTDDASGPVIIDAPQNTTGDGSNTPDAMIVPCDDDDSDGVCNAVDDWPCGAKPMAPAATVAMVRNGTATNLAVSEIDYAGQGQMVVIDAGQSALLSIHYAWTDTACPGNCRDRIEVGWVPGGRVGCAFDATVPKATGLTGNTTRTMDAPQPSTPTVYALEANIGQNSSCGTTTNWWAIEPASHGVLALVCIAQ